MLKTDIFDLVISKLKLAEYTTADVQAVIDEIEMVITEYCNIETVPNGLKFTWVNMSVDLYKSTYPDAEGEDSSIVTSIKVGDTQLNFGAGPHRVDVDKITMNYTAQMNRYKKVRW